MVKFAKKVNYIIGVLIALIILVTGFLLGTAVTQSRYTGVEGFETNLKINAFNFDIQYLLLQQEPCEFIEAGLNDELYVVGEQLVSLEEKRGFDNKDVIKLKNYYSILQIRDWLFLKSYKEKCRQDYILNLYFYSNLDCENCAEQGEILTSLRKKHPEIRTYAFDINLDNKALDALKKLYNVEETPTIVFDTVIISGFRTEEELEKVLNALK